MNVRVKWTLAWGVSCLVISVIVVEICLRFFGFGHPLLYTASSAGYEIVPNQTVDRLHKITHINGLGTRGPDAKLVPAEGTYRILCLGDSVSNGGTQINDDQTWPMQLQTLLMKRGYPVELLNAAAGGWAVQNEAAWLAEHGTFGAKLIILEVNEKDLDQPFAKSDLLNTNVSFPSKNPSTAIGELTTRYILPRLGLGGVSADPGSTDGAFQPENVATVLGAIDRIRSLSESKGGKLAILYWDIREQPSANVVHARDRLFAYARQNNIDLIRPNLNEDRKGNHFFRDGVHANVEGNIAISKILAKYFVNMQTTASLPNTLRKAS